MTRTDLVVFSRDLRVHDHPALATAVRHADHVVPLFVFDDAIFDGTFAAPNRVAYMLEALRDLDASLHARGGALIVRHGNWAHQVVAVAREFDAHTIHLTRDVSAWSERRAQQLRSELPAAHVAEHPGIGVVPAGQVQPTGDDHFKVFTPYWRQWEATDWRTVVAAPKAVSIPAGIETGFIPALEELVKGAPSPELVVAGETEARKRLNAWTKSHLHEYSEIHDALADDSTSHTSAALHFGCLSALEIATKLQGRPGADAFVRQLCWRDFYAQILAARRDASWQDFRNRGDRWNVDDAAFNAWAEGRTGYPLVDAGMRQLVREGFMHNRARMVTASFLTKDLYIDWRRGAQYFLDWLVDGDIANNNLNWQWTAGTGTDTNPHRIFNPVAQSRKFDPHGDYIRRYVPELSSLDAKEIHEPWLLGPLELERLGYPAPIVDHHEAIAEYRARRSS